MPCDSTDAWFEGGPVVGCISRRIGAGVVCDWRTIGDSGSALCGWFLEDGLDGVRVRFMSVEDDRSIICQLVV